MNDQEPVIEGVDPVTHWLALDEADKLAEHAQLKQTLLGMLIAFVLFMMWFGAYAAIEAYS